MTGGMRADTPWAPTGTLRAVGGIEYEAGMPAVGGPVIGGMPLPVPPARHQGIIFGQWPLRDGIELGSLPGAVPCARLHVRHVLWEWGLTQHSENAELVVSELMTNAVALPRPESAVPPVRLWLLADQTAALILVWDGSPLPPVPSDPGPDAESGRGLLLVEAVSTRWDWYLPSQAGGKVVWALTG
jgi:anti-sigma regulatory factor (Ser/Thr protein kinase)